MKRILLVSLLCTGMVWAGGAGNGYNDDSASPLYLQPGQRTFFPEDKGARQQNTQEDDTYEEIPLNSPEPESEHVYENIDDLQRGRETATPRPGWFKRAGNWMSSKVKNNSRVTPQAAANVQSTKEVDSLIASMDALQHNYSALMVEVHPLVYATDRTTLAYTVSFEKLEVAMQLAKKIDAEMQQPLAEYECALCQGTALDSLTTLLVEKYQKLSKGGRPITTKITDIYNDLVANAHLAQIEAAIAKPLDRKSMQQLKAESAPKLAFLEEQATQKCLSSTQQKKLNQIKRQLSRLTV